MIASEQLGDRQLQWEWQNNRVAGSTPNDLLVITVKPDQPEFRLGQGGDVGGGREVTSPPCC